MRHAFGIYTSDHEGHPPKTVPTQNKQMLHINDFPAAQDYVNRFDEIVESIVALISETVIKKVSRRNSNEELIPSKDGNKQD